MSSAGFTRELTEISSFLSIFSSVKKLALSMRSSNVRGAFFLLLFQAKSALETKSIADGYPLFSCQHRVHDRDS